MQTLVVAFALAGGMLAGRCIACSWHGAGAGVPDFEWNGSKEVGRAEGKQRTLVLADRGPLFLSPERNFDHPVTATGRGAALL